MWCVASAPIVPLARDLDAALGMQLSELAVHFRKLSTPLPTTPLPSRAHPRFFRKVSALLLTVPPPLAQHPRFFRTPPTPLLTAPLSISGSTHISSAHRPRHSDSPRAVSAPFRTCATSRPAAPHSLRAAIAAMGSSSENTKKRAPFLGERCSFWLLSGRKRPVILMFQKPQPKKTERTSCAKRMRMNMARG